MSRLFAGVRRCMGDPPGIGPSCACPGWDRPLLVWWIAKLGKEGKRNGAPSAPPPPTLEFELARGGGVIAGRSFYAHHFFPSAPPLSPMNGDTPQFMQTFIRSRQPLSNSSRAGKRTSPPSHMYNAPLFPSDPISNNTP